MNDFQTTDMQTAAFLIVLGYQLRAMESPADRREHVRLASRKNDVRWCYPGAGSGELRGRGRRID